MLGHTCITRLLLPWFASSDVTDPNRTFGQLTLIKKLGARFGYRLRFTTFARNQASTRHQDKSQRPQATNHSHQPSPSSTGEEWGPNWSMYSMKSLGNDDSNVMVSCDRGCTNANDTAWSITRSPRGHCSACSSGK